MYSNIALNAQDTFLAKTSFNISVFTGINITCIIGKMVQTGHLLLMMTGFAYWFIH